MINHVGWTAVAVAMFAVVGCSTPEMSPEAAQCKGGPGITADAKLSGCTAVIESGRESSEKLAEAFHNRCWIHEEKNERDAAIRDCSRAIELKPDYMDAFRQRGTVYFNKGEYDHAIADYSEAMRLGDNSVGIYSLRGWAYSSKGDYDRAIADYTRALQIYPGWGMAQGGLENANEAKARLAAGERPGDPRAWCQGNALPQDALVPSGLQVAGCTKLIESGKEKRGELAEDFFHRAQAYEVEELNHDRAIADYGEAIKLKPDYEEAYFWRGTIYSLEATYDRAIADYDRAIRLKPNQVGYFTYRGQAHYAKGQFASAIADFDRAIKLQPNSADAFVYRARAFIGKGDYHRAIADCDQAIKLSPITGVTATYDTRGDAYFHLGDWTHAIGDYDRALKLWPEYPSALYGRGAAKTHAGDVAGGQADMAAAEKLEANVATAEAKVGIKPSAR